MGQDRRRTIDKYPCIGDVRNLALRDLARCPLFGRYQG
jgi:hypothetical protein